MELWLYIVLTSIFVLAILALLQCKVRVPRLLTPNELDNARIRREAEREALLQDEVQKLQQRANIHKQNRLILTARRDNARLIEEGQEEWMARGKAIYGDAWDQPDDGNLPISELFNLPEDVLREIKIEAANLVQMETERRIRSETARENAELKSARDANYSGGGGSTFTAAFVQAPGLARPMPPPLPGTSEDRSGGASGVGVGQQPPPPPLTGSGGRRASKPVAGALFDDPRFVEPRTANSGRRRGGSHATQASGASGGHVGS